MQLPNGYPAQDPAMTVNTLKIVDCFNALSNNSSCKADQMSRRARTDNVQKRQRASRACDFCHARGLKCRWGPSDSVQGPSTCLTCVDYGVRCKIDRPVRKRGRKPTLRLRNEVSDPPDLDQYSHDGMLNDLGDNEAPSDASFVTNDFRSPSFVQRLVRIYCDTMYQC